MGATKKTRILAKRLAKKHYGNVVEDYEELKDDYEELEEENKELKEKVGNLQEKIEELKSENKKEKNTCKDCDAEISKGATRCQSCHAKHMQKG